MSELITKIAKARAYLAKLLAQQAVADIINSVAVGDTVTFTYGRADRKRELTGTVTATREIEQGLQVRVTVGEGFDEEAKVIFARDIVANVTQGITIADAIAEATGGEDTAEGEDPAEEDNASPEAPVAEETAVQDEPIADDLDVALNV